MAETTRRLETRAKELETQMTSLETETTSLRASAALWEARAKEEAEKTERADEEVRRVTLELETERITANTLEAQQKELLGRAAASEQEAQEKDAALRERERECAELRREWDTALETARKEAEKEMKEKEKEIEAREKEMEEKEKEVEEKKKEIEEKEKDVEEKEREVEEKRKEMDIREKEIEEKEKTIEEKEKEMEAKAKKNAIKSKPTEDTTHPIQEPPLACYLPDESSFLYQPEPSVASLRLTDLVPFSFEQPPPSPSLPSARFSESSLSVSTTVLATQEQLLRAKEEAEMREQASLQRAMTVQSQLVQLQTDYATLLEALHAKQRALTQLTETFQRQEETIEELRAELRARETKEAATIGEVRDSIALSGAPSFEVSEMPECGEVTVFVHEGQYGIHLWCDQTRSARSVGELQDVINEYESEVMAYQKNAELLEKEMARLMETEGSLKKRIWKMESLCKEFNTCLNDKEKELGACYKSLQQAASLLKKRGV